MLQDGSILSIFEMALVVCGIIFPLAAYMQVDNTDHESVGRTWVRVVRYFTLEILDIAVIIVIRNKILAPKWPDQFGPMVWHHIPIGTSVLVLSAVGAVFYVPIMFFICYFKLSNRRR